MAFKQFCRKQGCKDYREENGFCSKHQTDARAYDQYRESAAKRGYDGKWRKARDGYLRKHPLCIMCQQSGRVVVATVVDHITPHKGDKDLFWDRDNWQPLCKPHHDRKTATEDGGFGYERK